MLAQKQRAPRNDEERYISYEESLAILPIGRTKLSELVLGNKIASVLVGRRRLISLTSLRAFIVANSSPLSSE